MYSAEPLFAKPTIKVKTAAFISKALREFPFNHTGMLVPLNVEILESPLSGGPLSISCINYQLQ